MKTKDIKVGELYAVGSREWDTVEGIVLGFGWEKPSGYSRHAKARQYPGATGIAVALKQRSSYVHHGEAAHTFAWVPAIVRPQDIRALWPDYVVERDNRRTAQDERRRQQAEADRRQRQRLDRLEALIPRVTGKPLHLYGSAYDVRGVSVELLEKLIDLIPSEHFEIKDGES